MGEEETACRMPDTSWLLPLLSAGFPAASQVWPVILVLVSTNPHLLAFPSAFLLSVPSHQDVPPPGAVPLPSYFQTGEQELATQEQEARCRSVCDQLSLLRFPPSLLPSLPSLSSLSPSSSPFKFSREVYLPHRSQGRGRGGGASAASLASMKSGGDGLLQGTGRRTDGRTDGRKEGRND